MSTIYFKKNYSLPPKLNDTYEYVHMISISNESKMLFNLYL